MTTTTQQSTTELKVSVDSFLNQLQEEQSSPNGKGRGRPPATFQRVSKYANEIKQLFDQGVNTSQIHRWLTENEVKCSYAWLTLNIEALIELASEE